MANPWSEGRAGYAEGGRITRRASGLSRRRTVRRVASSPATNATGRTAAWATGRAAAGEPESGPALQPGDRDGGGETEGQRQGQAGRLEPGRQQAGSIPGGRGAGGALAAGGAAALSLGCSKVAGIGRNRHRLIGQMMTKARPITAFSGTVPPPGCPRWFLESS